LDGAFRWVDAVGPLILFWMMAVVGLELTVDDFRRVARQRTSVLVGTLGQWTLLPLAALGLVAALDLSGATAAGVVLITAAPGGGISNVFTYVARANTALSVTLTAVSSLCAVVTLPILTSAGFDRVGGEGLQMDVPVVPMIGQLALFVLLPIALGMAVRARRRELAVRWAGRLRRGVLITLVVFLAIGVSAGDDALLSDVYASLGVALLWTLVAMAVGFVVAVACRLDAADRFTFVIEYSVKNVGLAAIVAIAGFQRPELAVFAGAYVLVGYPLAVLACLGFRRLREGPTAGAPAGR
jgi:BASS family bile acid:Na+ symporter